MKPVNTDERAVQNWAGRIAADLKRWPGQDVPYGQVKRPRRQILAEWQAGRGDPAYWQKLLSEQPVADVLDYDRKMQEWERDHAGPEPDQPE